MNNLRSCLQSEQAYRETKEYKDNIEDEATLRYVLETIEEILYCKQSEPIEMVLGMRLIKELMDLHHECVLDGVTRNIVQLIEEIIKGDQKKRERGKYYFSENPDQQLMLLGNTLVRLSLESIFVWNLWHPHNPVISQIYQRLKQSGVEFPKLHYFNAQKVKEYYMLVKENSKNGTLCRQQSSVLNEQCFEQLKQAIERSQFNNGKLHEINEELKQIKTVNENQKLFIENFDKAYQDYLVNKQLEQFNNQIHSICQEYDEFQTYQNKNNQLCSYSTDKQSNHISRTVSYQNSQHKNNQSIEKLLQENDIIQAQIQSFEIPKASTKIQDQYY
ncbi:unnamed protein product (macronuclear) [Paramecium tetraurelia]|uniref:VHS domain-containing protein n=1 Tax=Paramecium tetraurelia TaxID=5888 RepID=A0E288_PARTE|nr:uncharacterized protein GSPATT00022577001 [Paramecium tetraurelia]CAK89405.1 unnamed protein product [Paramecium tetraurelia]|eukprot:XP_001456802.1 hypothetical protein (macronuclear) [Paramecium tetraurelia strain d4-2]